MNPSALDGFIDNQLPAQERMELNAHVMQCDACQAELLLRQQGKSAIAELQAPTMSLDFDAKLPIPKRFFFDPSDRIADDERSIEVSNFAVVPEPGFPLPVAITLFVVTLGLQRTRRERS